MGCGCQRRRQKLAMLAGAVMSWFRRFFRRRGDDWMPPGVPRALQLANKLRKHCDAHNLHGGFAGVFVPRRKEVEEHEPAIPRPENDR